MVALHVAELFSFRSATRRSSAQLFAKIIPAMVRVAMGERAQMDLSHHTRTTVLRLAVVAAAGTPEHRLAAPSHPRRKLFWLTQSYHRIESKTVRLVLA
jgi:hypothetical protein